MYSKLLTLLFILPFLMIGFIQNAYSKKNNPAVGHTGALNQPSCGFSNSTNTCHGSTNGGQHISDLLSLNTDVKLFAGNTEVTSGTFKYKPDSIYALTLKLMNPNNLNGFSLTVENNGNIMSGSLSIPNGSSAKLNPSNADYINQNGNTGVSEWDFNWAAPAASNGDVTFYATVNRSNNNNATSGDEIIPFKMEIAEKTTTAISDINIKNEISIKGNPILNNTLSFDLMVNEPKQYSVQVFDLSGKIIHTETRTYHAGLKSFNINFEQKGVFILNIKTNKNEQAQFKIIN